MKTTQQQPNVIVVLVDDQGYGDLSCHGNPVLKTPNLDKLHDESVRMTDFHACPICTPSRCELMTGAHNLSAGACFVDGARSIMRPEYPTMPELFADAGYATGHFGKWHLGDNRPYRPHDRGFDISVHHGAWGITSTPDYWNNDCFDDVYFHNDEQKNYTGYCTDVWFDEAMNWMKEQSEQKRPFFTYLATNAPHTPLFVGDDFRRDYGDLDTALASFFGMIANLDENMGRLDRMLVENGLRDNTILIYMTDNGGTVGVNFYNAGMRGRKHTLYEGGHRVPCFIRWPNGDLRSPGDINELASIQDILPTLVEFCELKPEKAPPWDGVSLADLLKGATDRLNDRTLVIQTGQGSGYLRSHPVPLPLPLNEGDPVKHDATVLRGPWRLVHGEELYHIQDDPAQETDLATRHPDILNQLRGDYENWWESRQADFFRFTPIPIGAAGETVLTAHNWVTENIGNQTSVRKQDEWRPRSGPWIIRVEEAGEYLISLRRWPREADLPITGSAPEYRPHDMTFGPFPEGNALPISEAKIHVQNQSAAAPVTDDDHQIDFKMKLAPGETRLFAWFCGIHGNVLCGAFYAYINKIT